MTPPTRYPIVRINLSLAAHAQALVTLLDEYARSPEGGGHALSAQVRASLCAVLAARPHYAGWLAFAGDQAVGLLNCFEGVSTFRAQPLLNVHDIMVSAPFRRQGIGRALLSQAELHARATGCCKLTLEVLEGNRSAIAAYTDAGFAPYQLDPTMGQARFFEKMLR